MKKGRIILIIVISPQVPAAPIMVNAGERRSNTAPAPGMGQPDTALAAARSVELMEVTGRYPGLRVMAPAIDPFAFPYSG